MSSASIWVTQDLTINRLSTDSDTGQSTALVVAKQGVRTIYPSTGAFFGTSGEFNRILGVTHGAMDIVPDALGVTSVKYLWVRCSAKVTLAGHQQTGAGEVDVSIEINQEMIIDVTGTGGAPFTDLTVTAASAGATTAVRIFWAGDATTPAP